MPGISSAIVTDVCAKLFEARAFPASFDVEQAAPTYQLLHDRHPVGSDVHRCLYVMLLMEYVDLIHEEATRTAWRLTVEALRAMRCVRKLQAPRPVFACHDEAGSLENHTLYELWYELWLTLHSDGWEIQVLAKRQRRASIAAYDGGDAEKRFSPRSLT